jgi:hypothetical protein
MIELHSTLHTCNQTNGSHNGPNLRAPSQGHRSYQSGSNLLLLLAFSGTPAFHDLAATLRQSFIIISPNQITGTFSTLRDSQVSDLKAILHIVPSTTRALTLIGLAPHWLPLCPSSSSYKQESISTSHKNGVSPRGPVLHCMSTLSHEYGMLNSWH